MELLLHGLAAKELERQYLKQISSAFQRYPSADVQEEEILPYPPLLIHPWNVVSPRLFPDQAAILPQGLGESDVKIGGIRLDQRPGREIYFLVRDGEHISALALVAGVGRLGVIDFPSV